MIVDCHTHASTEEQRSNLMSLFNSGVLDAAFVLAEPQEDLLAGNQQVAEFVTSHQGRLVGWAAIDPTQQKYDEDKLRAMTLDLGLYGIALYCARHAYNPTHSHAMKLYEVAQTLNIPVFFHNSGMDSGDSGSLSYAQPHLLDEVAQVFPDMQIIIGGMGVPFVEQTMAVLVRHENVFADLTICPTKVWQTYNIVITAYENNVMNKLLFGSGFPRGDAGRCIETLLGFNMRLADSSLPTVPRGSIRAIVERDSLKALGIQDIKVPQPEIESVEGVEQEKDIPEQAETQS